GRPCAAPPRRARARPAARPRPARPRPWGGAPRRRRRGPSARPSAPAEHASEQSSRRPRRSWGLFYTAAMKRSLQEYVELVVFGLVALLVGTGLLWLMGWALSLGGVALRWVAGLLWTLLRFIVPVAIAGGLVYFLVKAAQDRQPRPAAAGTPVSAPPPPAPAPATSGGDGTLATPPSTVS